MKGDQEKCLAAGMDDYITKPIKRGDLEEKLYKWLNSESMTPGKALLKETAVTIYEKTIDKDIITEFRAVVGDSFNNILNNYLANAEEMMAWLRESLKVTDIKGIHDAAHSLKSSSQQIGALALKAVLADIERYAASGEKFPISALVDDAETQFTAAKKALYTIMNAA